MDMEKRGWTTVQLKVSPPCREFPKGGTYNRLEKLLIHPTETWDNVISRLIDFFEAHNGR